MGIEEQVKLLNHLLMSNAVLRERFGEATTLGELNAAFRAHRSMAQGEVISITTLAADSGLSKSSLSGMIKRRPHVTMTPHPDDDRVKTIGFDDTPKRLAYLEDVLDGARSVQHEQGFVKPDSLMESVKKHLGTE